ncbi:hypothetical protein J3459_008122 [Metarhizium acridum]|nr:hypothetical protein J3459_008122 [Metarhizium acridum]
MEPRKARLIDSFNLDASHFEPNAIFRGAQLTLVGAYRALQNPDLFTTEYYKQAINSDNSGEAVLWFTSLLYPRDQVSWNDSVVDWLNFMGDYVLQLPFFLMMVMRHVVPTLDNLFMQSLNWVDVTYVQKHKHDNPSNLRDLYYPQSKVLSISEIPSQKETVIHEVHVKICTQSMPFDCGARFIICPYIWPADTPFSEFLHISQVGWTRACFHHL